MLILSSIPFSGKVWASKLRSLAIGRRCTCIIEETGGICNSVCVVCVCGVCGVCVCVCVCV
jgi:hypothetical protein